MSKVNDELVTVVDSQDRVVDAVPRTVLRQSGLNHRVTYLIVFNSKGQLLVQTRTDEKDVYPGFLDLAAGGVVQAGEGYDESARRELEEELGITVPLVPRFRMYFEETNSSPGNRCWGWVYTCISEGPFVLQPEEVAAAEFMDVDTALEIDPGLVTPDTRLALTAYLT